MADIVGSLFGATPQQVQSEMVAPIFNRANQFAQLNPMQQAQYGLYSGGAMLGQGVAGLLGGEDPRLVQARQMQQVKDWIAQSGVDINSPEGLAQAAQYAQSIGATEGAMFLGQRSQDMRQQQATATRTEQQAAREQQKFNLEDQLRSELSNLPPDASDEQVISVVRKYGDPTQILKALETKQAKLAGEGVTGAAGSVGKAGAYRDVDGVVHGAAEMKTVNQEFKANQDLLKDLNDIKYDDIKDAVSSFGIDYTTKGDVMKWFGGNKVQAQAKIAMSKLTQALENLPPGSASDADIRLALSTFPGYGSTENLVNWLNETKKRLSGRIDSTSTTFGFKPTVRSSGNVAAPQTAPQATSGTYSDPAKEARYQAYKKQQGL